MGNHIRLNQAVPAAYKTLLLLNDGSSAAAAVAGLEPLELVKIRCSQINGCAFCLRVHIRDAISHGALLRVSGRGNAFPLPLTDQGPSNAARAPMTESIRFATGESSPVKIRFP
jgi:AhpD family alkylhydroperoxidase